MRPDYIRRFHAMVDELRSRPDVALARAYVAPPVSEETIARVHAKLGFAIGDRVLGFYRQANGLALEWVPRAHGAYDPESHGEELAEPFDMVPQDVAGGVINVYPFESIVDDYEDVFWFDSMAGRTIEVGGEVLDLLAFSRAIRPFDYFSEEAMAALLLHGRAADPPVRIGHDHGASFTRFSPTDFETYMEGVLALRGSGVFRERWFCESEGPPPGTPEAWREVAPSLDAIVRASLERDALTAAAEDELGDELGEAPLDDFDADTGELEALEPDDDEAD